MAAAYSARFPYPPDTFEILDSLRRSAGPVCEIGAGNGRLTIGLARRVGRVDAIEPSQAMVDAARAQGAEDSEIRWTVAPFEQAGLDGPYSLVVASDAIHWLDWNVAFAKIAGVLAPDGYLALVSQDELEPGTDEPSLLRRTPELRVLLNEYSTNDEYEAYDLIQSLRDARVLELVGVATASRATTIETLERVITRLHSMNGLAPAALGNRLDEFDRRARRLLLSLSPSGEFSTDVRPVIRWGRPASR